MDQLPGDILNIILAHLDIPSILSFRSVSRFTRQLVTEKFSWPQKERYFTVEKDLPFDFEEFHWAFQKLTKNVPKHDLDRYVRVETFKSSKKTIDTMFQFNPFLKIEDEEKLPKAMAQIALQYQAHKMWYSDNDKTIRVLVCGPSKAGKTTILRRIQTLGDLTTEPDFGTFSFILILIY